MWRIRELVKDPFALSVTPLWRVRLMQSLTLEAPIRQEPKTDGPLPAVTAFRTKKGVALVAYLALHPGPQERHLLAARLWREAEPAAARKSLTMEVSDLRKRLEAIAPADAPPLLTVERETVGFMPEAFTADVAVFQSRLRQARRTDDLDSRKALLQEAITLWSPLLPGIEAAFLKPLRERHLRTYADAVTELSEILVVEGAGAAALDLLGEVLARSGDDPALRRRALELHRAAGMPTASLPPSVGDVDEEERLFPLLRERWQGWQAERKDDTGEEAEDEAAQAERLRPSLTQVLEETISRMNPSRQRLYIQLSFFEHSFTPALVTGVCQVKDAANLLEELRRERLLVSEGNGRYRMLHALRRSALARLEASERKTLIRRHRDYWLDHLWGAFESGENPKLLLPDWPNILQAIEQALELVAEAEKVVHLVIVADHALADRLNLVADTTPFIERALARPLPLEWRARAHLLAYHHFRALPYEERIQYLYQAAAFYKQMPEQTRSETEYLASIFARLGLEAHHAEEHERVPSLYSQAVDLYRQIPHRGVRGALQGWAENLLYVGRTDEAIRLYQEMQSISEGELPAVGELIDRIHVGRQLATLHHCLGDYGAARRYANQCLAAARQYGDPGAISSSLRILALLQAEQGHYAEAEHRLTEEALRLAAVGELNTRAAVLGHLGDIAQGQGDPDRAEALYREGLAEWRERGHKGWTGLFLARLALNTLHRGRSRVAQGLADEAEPVCRASGSRRRVAVCRYAQGRILTRLGKTDAARAHLREALSLWEACRYPLGVARTHEALAALLTHLGDPSAISHHEEATRLRQRMGTPLPPIEENATF